MIFGKVTTILTGNMSKGSFVFPMMVLLSGAVAADAPRITLNFELYAQGRYVYERNCIICHGPRGDGQGEMSKTVMPKPRSFREGMFKFRTTPYDKLPTEDDLRRTITGGLSGTAMGMFTQLQPDDVTAVIEYVKSFSRRWRKPENHAESLKFPPPPDWLTDEKLRVPHAAAGKVLFANICATCHGPAADGKGPTAPLLKDIWGLPAVPSDLRQPHLRCGDEPADVFRVLTTGMSGTPMISFAQTLTDAQRWQVAAYIASIRIAGQPVLNPAPPTARVSGR
jgi:cytochrome c oxidase cbb3-type subunit I/II